MYVGRQLFLCCCCLASVLKKKVKISAILIKSTHNLLGLKNMIGLVQQINKISHPRGNFAHGQFSVLVGDLHTSVCLLRWWMVEDGEGGRWGQRGLRYLVDHINSGGDTGHPSWPDRLSPLACTWTGPTSGSNFPFSFVDHLTMCFPRLGQMSSHSWSTSGLYTPGKALPRCLQLPMTTIRTVVPQRWAQTAHFKKRSTERTRGEAIKQM